MSVKAKGIISTTNPHIMQALGVGTLHYLPFQYSGGSSCKIFLHIFIHMVRLREFYNGSTRKKKLAQNCSLL